MTIKLDNNSCVVLKSTVQCCVCAWSIHVPAKPAVSAGFGEGERERECIINYYLVCMIML